ncbi:MAG TPA: Scr1 family TA system antitoxin-like transcriptional regulator [Candidatus Dormibacteraeota bacterium]|jgi:transcriptional regulator with XRE-family HTH domain
MSRRPDIYPAPRIEFGRALRQARIAAGLEGQEVGRRTGIIADTISRFETGKRFPTKRETAEALAAAIGLDAAGTATLLEQYDEAATLDKLLRSTIPYGPKAAQEGRNKLLDAASDVATFAVAEIPYYLQTLEYARQDLGDAPDVEQTARLRVDAGVNVGAEGKSFDIIVTEAALRLPPCESSVMRDQIAALHGVIGRDHVEFGIIPLGVALTAPLKNAFTIYDETTVIDTYAGEITLTPKRAPRYTDLMDRLSDDAVRDADARQILDNAAADLR